MICDGCLDVRPTRYVLLAQAIGAVLITLTTRYQQNLCDSCLTERHSNCTLTTALAGWWSVTGLAVTPFVLVQNSLECSRALSWEPVAPDSGAAELAAEMQRQAVVHAAYEESVRATFGGALCGFGLILAIAYVAGADVPAVGWGAVITVPLGAALIARGLARRARVLATLDAPPQRTRTARRRR